MRLRTAAHGTFGSEARFEQSTSHADQSPYTWRTGGAPGARAGPEVVSRPCSTSPRLSHAPAPTRSASRAASVAKLISVPFISWVLEQIGPVSRPAYST